MKGMYDLIEFWRKRMHEQVIQEVEDLHEAINRRNRLYNDLILDINILEANGITYDKLKSFMHGKGSYKFIKTIRCASETKGEVLRVKYNALTFVASKRIPKLQDDIERHARMTLISHYYCYWALAFTNYVLYIDSYKGTTIPLGSNMGNLRIIVHEANYNKQNINWKESMLNRREMEANGIVPKSIWRPDGIEWRVFYEQADYLYVRWNRATGKSNVPFMSHYKYRPMFNKELMDFLEKYFMHEYIIDEIAESDFSVRDKMRLIRKHLDYRNMYPYEKNNKKRCTDQGDDRQVQHPVDGLY